MVKNSNEYQRNYYKVNNISFICECGGKYKKYLKSAHEKTDKHKNYILEKEKPMIDKKKAVIDYIKFLSNRVKELEADKV